MMKESKLMRALSFSILLTGATAIVEAVFSLVASNFGVNLTPENVLISFVGWFAVILVADKTGMMKLEDLKLPQ